MKKIILLISTLFFYLVAIDLYAQNSEIDSLEKLIQKHTTKDTIRVNLLNTTAHKLYIIDVDKTLLYAKEAQEISNQIGFERGKAQSLVLMGIYYDEKADFLDALNSYKRALQIYKKLNDKSGITKCYNNLGIIYRYQGDYPSALEYYQKSLNIAEEINDKRGISYSYNNIGIIYFYQGNYSKSLEYYQKSLKIDEETNDKSGVSYSLNNIGIIYEFQKDYPKALEYYQKSLKIKEELRDKSGIATCLNNIGTIYRYIHDYSSAYESYQKALELNKELGRKTIETYSFIGLASFYLEQNQIKLAYKHSKKAYQLAKEIGNAELIKESSEILAKSANALGYYQDAYKYHVIYKAMYDSLFNEKNTRKITGLEYQYKYEREKKIEELAQQKKDAVRKEKEKREKITRNSFIAGFILMSLLVLIVFRNLVQKRKANRILATQKEEIKLQAEEVKVTNEKLRVLNSRKDKFFSIISHDLISPFNAILGYSSLLLRNYNKYDDKKRENMIESMHESSNNAFKLLQDLLTWSRSQFGGVDFSPETINLNNLIQETIFDLQGQAKSKGIKVLNNVQENTTIFADKNMISAVLRNLVSNAIKFTHKGGEIKIDVQNRDEDILLSVSDNGVGMSQEKLSKIFKLSEKTSTLGTNQETGTGLGLILCKEFVEQHGGTIWAESELNRGSTFSFTIPNK